METMQAYSWQTNDYWCDQADFPSLICKSRRRRNFALPGSTLSPRGEPSIRCLIGYCPGASGFSRSFHFYVLNWKSQLWGQLQSSTACCLQSCVARELCTRYHHVPRWCQYAVKLLCSRRQCLQQIILARPCHVNGVSHCVNYHSALTSCVQSQKCWQLAVRHGGSVKCSRDSLTNCIHQ